MSPELFAHISFYFRWKSISGMRMQLTIFKLHVVLSTDVINHRRHFDHEKNFNFDRSSDRRSLEFSLRLPSHPSPSPPVNHSANELTSRAHIPRMWITFPLGRMYRRRDASRHVPNQYTTSSRSPGRTRFATPLLALYAPDNNFGFSFYLLYTWAGVYISNVDQFAPV